MTARTIYGGEGTNTYLLETTGTGVAAFDYDGDGWLDIFFVNGTTLEGFPKGQEPTNHLYRNRGDGTFEDVTARAGLGASGWGQGACAGDYDNDGHDDLFVTYWGQNRLYHNDGDGTFDDVTARAGLTQSRTRWSTGCAFLDYDRDGRLDLFAANYIDLDLATTPTPRVRVCAATRGCRWPADRRGCPAARTCSTTTAATARSRTSPSESGITTRQRHLRARRRARSTSTATAGSTSTSPTTPTRARSIATITTARSPTSRFAPAARTARTASRRPAWASPSATTIATARWTSSRPTSPATPRRCTRTPAEGSATTGPSPRASGSTRAGSAGASASSISTTTAGSTSSSPTATSIRRCDQLKSEAGYEQRKVVYRNLGNGRFADVSERSGAPVTTPKAARGAAFGDFDNDGDVDVVVNNVNDTPDLFRLDRRHTGALDHVKLVGAPSRTVIAIGALVRVITADGEQRQEVRGGGSYFSQNDLRLHFGLGHTAAIQQIVVRWPNGREESFAAPAIDRLHTLIEGTGSR